jgi:hypothetical protein
VSYDLEFIQLPLPPGLTPPVEVPPGSRLLEQRIAFDDPVAVRQFLLSIDGCRPGPGDAIDFMGRGLNSARMFVKASGIHVENNCGAGELLRLYGRLAERFHDLLILDLQSRKVYNAESFTQWWSRPL